MRVPVANLIGEEGEGFALGPALADRSARVSGHGARCVGIAERALELVMAYAQQRVTFGQPLSERQAIQFMIADSAMEHARGPADGLRVRAWSYDQGEDVRNESLHDQDLLHRDGHRVVDRAIQIHGGMGLTTRAAAGVLVPPGAQHPHHRGLDRGAALAPGAQPDPRRRMTSTSTEY